MLHEIECLYCKKKVQKEITKSKYRKIPVYCSRECQLRGQNFEWDRADDEEKKSKILQNFYRNLIIRNGCWGYKKLKNEKYVRIEIGKRKVESLHRISYELHYGPIPKGMQINHKCHNPRCCRPSHLYLGTQQDNINDQIERGTFQKGSKHGNSILNEKQVAEIKVLLKEGKMLHREIAEKYSVDRTTITDIRRGKTWNHIEA